MTSHDDIIWGLNYGKERYFMGFLWINIKNKIRSFFTAEADGLGVIEIILIIVVIIGLVILFRDQIQELIKSLFKQINKAVSEV